MFVQWRSTSSIIAATSLKEQVNGGQVLSDHIIPRPHENLEYALPIHRSTNVEHFSADICFPPPLSA
ncbi:hypothetical protein [Fischerella thermalis]|uniref:hypothetical protein n=1 Tax=Fischerella thermalis TaxID=372787 RepID=UPI0026C5F07E